MKPKLAPPTEEAGLPPPLTFAVNIIVPSEEPAGNQLIVAGKPSPYRSVDEVPPALVQFIGSPPGGNVDAAGWGPK